MNIAYYFSVCSSSDENEECNESTSNIGTGSANNSSDFNRNRDIGDNAAAADSGIDEGASSSISTKSDTDNLMKRNNKRPDWTHVVTYYNLVDYKKYVQDERFATDNTCTTKKVVNRYLRCIRVKGNGPKCDARLCVRMSKSEVSWVILKNGLEHTCETVNNKMHAAVRERLENLRKERIPPSKALSIVTREFGEKAPSLGQIHHINRRTDARTNKHFANLGNVIEWLRGNCIQKGDDGAFVLDYWHSTMEDTRADFQNVISTPRLLKNAVNLRIVCCDGTYKLNVHDYPVIVVGGIDVNQKMHVIAFSVTTKEEGKNFEFIFSAIKRSIKKLHQIAYRPEILVSDAACAISNGFFAAFPEVENIKNVTCWFHVQKAAKNRIEKEYHCEVVHDLHAIHMSSSETTFKRAVALFSEKWSMKLPEFCEYFQKYWVNQHFNCYEAYVDKCPATNNGLEGFNSYIKRCLTFRELLPLGLFNDLIYTSIVVWRKNSWIQFTLNFHNE